MLEKYYKYKLDYRNYILLIKSGNFYEVLDNDAFIINELFNYKLRKISNTLCVGFPTKSLDNVINKLNNININYLVIDNQMIIIKKEFNNNMYNTYKYDDKNIYYNILRVEKIIKFLNSNIMKENFNNKLNKIEKILNGSEIS